MIANLILGLLAGCLCWYSGYLSGWSQGFARGEAIWRKCAEDTAAIWRESMKRIVAAIEGNE